MILKDDESMGIRKLEHHFRKKIRPHLPKHGRKKGRKEGE
jgi:hypothetical protein